MNPSALRALLVDDDPDDRLLLRRELRRLDEGAEVLELGDPGQLEEVLARGPWDLVLADYGLRAWRGLDGLQLLEQVRRRYPEHPFLLVSGGLATEVVVEAFRRGVDDVVLKDQPERLGPAIQAVLERREQQRQAAARLHASEERFRRFFQGHSVGMALLDPQGRFREANQALADFLGLPSGSLAGREIRRLLHPESEALLEPMLEPGTELEPGQLLPELQFLGDQGQPLWGRVSWTWLRDPEGTPRSLGLLVIDTTSSRRLATQLESAQHLESLGRLAGGVAHDFNNMLGILVAQAEMVREDLGKGNPLARDLDLILETCDRASELVRKLLFFSRKQPMARRRLDLGELVGNHELLLRRALGERIRLEVEVEEDLPLVLADRASLEQVLLNLVLNARDAIPEHGEVTVRLGEVELAAEEARRHHGLRPGPHLRLEVEDTGGGIAPGVLRHIFEPFFTTKEPSSGTGLGLSTVYGIVRESGGTVEVTSEPGQGTTFRVLLPAVPERAPTASAPGTRLSLKSFQAREGETILLVEDEEDLRYVTRRFLERAGYQVLDAASPKRALELAGRAERLDLLVTDIVMPEMDGGELAERVLESRPDLPVIYMSGYSRDIADRRGLLEKGSVYLPKPVTRAELLARVDGLLHKRPAGR